MKKYFLFIFFAGCLVSAETLFEVKDAMNNPVLNVSTDGLRILNQGDTLMVISSDEIRANIGVTGRGLSRAFSVTTTQSKGSGNDLMRLTADSTRFWISDTGSGFGVSSQTAAKEKSVATNFLKVSNANTEMREGTAGDRYTDFSPENMFLGLRAGSNTIPTPLQGISNIFIGNEAGLTNGTGHRNVFIGPDAGYSNTGGFSGVFIGYQAGYSNLSAFDNIFIGSSSGFSNTTGYNNIFIGAAAGQANTEGMGNIFIGTGAGVSNVGDVSFEGYNNIFFGNNSGYENITGANNVYLGNGTGFSMTGGGKNVFVGEDVGRAKTGGDNNVMLGYRSGYNNSSGGKNIFIGYQAGYNETGSDKLYIDNSNTSSPLIYGDFASDLLKINGLLNVIGSPTMGTLMIAPSEVTSGDDAEIVLAEDNDGTYNMSIKYDGGANRLEWWAEDDAGSYGPLMYLGYNTLGGGISYFSTGFIRPMSDNIYDLGASTLRWDDIYATNGVIQTSDKRQKSEVKDMDYGLNTIMKMRPVTYLWKDKPERGR
ncbi:MAG: tail fiber domain-containing protein, partial [Bacteroidales bacterium]|nr:tail fiber domain-containing protein [Bacteroidales bacterium]